MQRWFAFPFSVMRSLTSFLQPREAKYSFNEQRKDASERRGDFGGSPPFQRTEPFEGGTACFRFEVRLGLGLGLRLGLAEELCP